MPDLKETHYRVRDGWAKVAYLVRDKEIYFSGLDKNRSTINWAEAVVEAICEAEHIDWRNYTFYDVQTNTGYSHDSDPGYYTIDQLVIMDEGDRIHVTCWDPIVNREGGETLIKRGVPEEILDAFAHLII